MAQRKSFITSTGAYSLSLGGVPREHKMLQGHLPRVVYHQVHNVYCEYTLISQREAGGSGRGGAGVPSAQRMLLHTWILSVITKQHLVQIGRIDGPDFGSIDGPEFGSPVLRRAVRGTPAPPRPPPPASRRTIQYRREIMIHTRLVHLFDQFVPGVALY